MIITTTTDITSQQVADLFCGAFEGGSNEWLGQTRIEPDRYKGWDGIWYGDPKFWERDDFVVTFDPALSDMGEGPWGEEIVTITPEKLAAGFQRWAEQSPTSFGDFIREEDDAYTHDSFLQNLVLGEEIFG